MPKLFVLIEQEDVPFSEVKSLTKIANILHFSKREILIAINIPNNIVIEAQRVVGPKIEAPKQAIEGFFRKWKNCGGLIFQNEKNYLFTKDEEVKTAVGVSSEIVEAKIEEISKSWKESLDVLPVEWSRPVYSISAFLEGVEVEHKYSLNCLPFEEVQRKANEVKSLKNAKSQIEENISKFEEMHRASCVLRSLVFELAWLYEAPCFVEAEIPQEYLDLPKEVLILTIVSNQRYILFKKDGKIFPKFLIVGKRYNEEILQGHLKTLKARLEDAKYYIEKDVQNFCFNGISSHLEKIIFHQRYGSVAQRVQEMKEVANSFFANDESLQRAVEVSKNDLTTHTVQSFTELQGVCGGYFLEKNGVDENICIAVSQHYKPLNPSDELPPEPLARKLSFVDKLQKVNALAEIDEIPTSSRDPFAIRRDILSIVRICYVEKWNFDREIFHEKLQSFVQERVKLFAKDFLIEEDSAFFLENFQKNGKFVK